MNFKFKNYIYLFLFCGVIFCFSLNVFAQDFTISDCKTATEETLKKIKYPCVDNVKLLDKDNKEDRKTFTKGEMVKFNANVESANELKHVRVFVKKGETLVALIVLKDDGSTKSGDAVAGDNTYSSNWEIPHSFSAQEEYAMVMEAVDERGNKYETEVDEYVKKDKNKDSFFVGEVCKKSEQAKCTEGDFMCDGGMRRKCVRDNKLECNYWQNDKNCSPKVCCGEKCCGEGYVCSSNDECIYCDDKCDAEVLDTVCINDPDNNQDGCCGDNECNNADKNNGECKSCGGSLGNDCYFNDCKSNDYCDPLVGEDPGNTPGTCKDTDGPEIEITSPQKTVYFGTSIIVRAKIKDNFYEIKSEPTFKIIRDSDQYEVATGSLLRDSAATDMFSSENALSIDSGWGHGKYIIKITAEDVQPSNASGLSNTATGDFMVLCISECELKNFYCSPPNNEGNSLFVQECELDSSIGCRIRKNLEDCSDKKDKDNPDSIGICKKGIKTDKPGCCEENCEPGSYSKTCEGGTAIKRCIEEYDGCYRVSPNDCKNILKNDNAVCRSGTSGDNCCVDDCSTIGVTCSSDGKSKVFCEKNEQTGCNVERTETCGGLTCVSGGTDGPTCCDNDKYTGGVTDGFRCLGSKLIGVESDKKTGCFKEYTKDDCYDFDDPEITGGYGYCKYNTVDKKFNCCEENCNPSTYGNKCSVDGRSIKKCDTRGDGCNSVSSGEICVDILKNDNAVCRSGTSGDNCCVNECDKSDPDSCDANFEKIQKCVKDRETGCFGFEEVQNCKKINKACYPGGSNNAECGDMDSSPPEVTLKSQQITNITWTEKNNADFNDGSYLRLNSYDNNILLNKLSDAKTVGNSDWSGGTYNNTERVNASVGVKELTGSGYPSSGYYTAYIDGGEIASGKQHKWSSFKLDGIFPSGFATKMDLQIMSSDTTDVPVNINSSGCGFTGVSNDETVVLSSCTEVDVNHRYIYYRVTLYSN